MNTEQFYTIRNYPRLDPFDKKVAKFTYYDMLDFAEYYAKYKLNNNDITAEEIIKKYPSVKIGLDDHYGRQTVLNMINEALNQLKDN